MVVSMYFMVFPHPAKSSDVPATTEMSQRWSGIPKPINRIRLFSCFLSTNKRLLLDSRLMQMITHISEPIIIKHPAITIIGPGQFPCKLLQHAKPQWVCRKLDCSPQSQYWWVDPLAGSIGACTKDQRLKFINVFRPHCQVLPARQGNIVRDVQKIRPDCAATRMMLLMMTMTSIIYHLLHRLQPCSRWPNKSSHFEKKHSSRGCIFERIDILHHSFVDIPLKKSQLAFAWLTTCHALAVRTAKVW